MPRTIKDILDHADELANRFEGYEPSATDERDPAVFAELRRAVPFAIGCRALHEGRGQTRARMRLLLGVHRLAGRNLRRSSPSALRS